MLCGTDAEKSHWIVACRSNKLSSNYRSYFLCATALVKQLPYSSICIYHNHSTYCATRGYADVNISIENTSNDIRLTVTDTLVAEVICGMDLLARQETVESLTGGRVPKITFQQ